VVWTTIFIVFGAMTIALVLMGFDSGRTRTRSTPRSPRSTRCPTA
jgi:hypothetical protein